MARAFAPLAVLGPIPSPRHLPVFFVQQENTRLPLNRALAHLVPKESMPVAPETLIVLTVLPANSMMPSWPAPVLTALLVLMPLLLVHSCARTVPKANILVPTLIVASLALLVSTLLVRVKLSVRAAPVVPSPSAVPGHAPPVLPVSFRDLPASPHVSTPPRALMPPLVPPP